jgi:hypothetical protein
VAEKEDIFKQEPNPCIINCSKWLMIRAHQEIREEELSRIAAIVRDMDNLMALSGFKYVKYLKHSEKSKISVQSSVHEAFKQSWVVNLIEEGSTDQTVQMNKSYVKGTQ